MFVDGRELPGGTELVADLRIIGAGTAGIAIARELDAQRRRLVGALLGSGCCAITITGCGRSTAIDLGDLLDVEAARHVGQAYLAETPAAANPSTLLTLLTGDQRPATDEEFAEQLRTRIAADFDNPETTRVLGGWVLSVTECRLAALATFSRRVDLR